MLCPPLSAQVAPALTYEVGNCDRSIGARLSGEIAKRYGNTGMAESPIRLNLKGVAGQSLGVWNAGGLEIYLEGDANDYVGKGMAGGKLVLRPPAEQQFKPPMKRLLWAIPVSTVLPAAESSLRVRLASALLCATLAPWLLSRAQAITAANI